MSYKIGDVINGYILNGLFTEKFAGRCTWTLATKAKKDYFIKRFLEPKLPTPIMSEEVRKIKLEKCCKFVLHHQMILTLFQGQIPDGGNLIVTREFFAWNGEYFKTTEKVQNTIDNISEIFKLSFEQKLLILKTITHSIMLLHNKYIVHGDLRPLNLMIRCTDQGAYVGAVIDFDDYYITGKPPTPQELVFYPDYISPEALRYVNNDPTIQPSELTTQSDIFALGLIFHQYLTGTLPQFNHEKYDSACKVVIDHGDLVIQNIIPDWLSKLINEMLTLNPQERPTIQEVLSCLKGQKPPTHKTPDTPPDKKPEESSSLAGDPRLLKH